MNDTVNRENLELNLLSERRVDDPALSWKNTTYDPLDLNADLKITEWHKQDGGSPIDMVIYPIHSMFVPVKNNNMISEFWDQGWLTSQCVGQHIEMINNNWHVLSRIDLQHNLLFYIKINFIIN